jgi:hypothetical protein
MKKLRRAPQISRNKKLACTVSAAALMLGVSSAATVGLHFQENYCGSAAYSGYIVTLPAFGIAPLGWENLTPMNTGYSSCKLTAAPYSYTLNEVISTNTATNGLNPLPNGSLNVMWSGPTANYNPFAGYAGSPPNYYGPGGSTAARAIGTNPLSGEEQIYATFIRDGINFGPPGGPNNDQPGYLVDITGLKSVFTNSSFVVELMASGDSIETLTNALVIDVTGLITNSVSYPNTPPVVNSEGSSYYQGTGGGLSTGSAALNTDHIQITSVQPVHVAGQYNHAGTISGFIITDKPVVSMSPRSLLAGPADSIVLNPYAIGVPPLSYQWRKNGSAISAATNSTYAIAAFNLANGGNYDLVVTNVYGATTSAVATVTGDVITQTYAAQTVFDSNPANPQRDGTDLGATWEATNSDGKTTRSGVMQFVAAKTNGISVPGTTNFDFTAGTVSFWMRSAGTDTSTSGSEGASLFCVPTGTAGSDFILFQLDGTFGNMQFQSPGSALAFDTSKNISDNNWHFVAVTFDESATGGAAVFVDGALDTTNSNGSAWATPVGKPIEFGYSTDSTFRAYNGLLGDIRIYNRILATNEIASVFQTGALVDTNALQVRFNFSAPPGEGIVLTWQESTAVLQSATNVNGPYTDVKGVSSPYTVVPAATQMFFRYRYLSQSLESNPYLM